MSSVLTLKKDAEFRRVFNKGRYKAGGMLVAYVLNVKHISGHSVMGVSVTKKYGNAVRRNRMRRLVKESFRLNQDRIKDGYHIVFAVRNQDRVPTYYSVKKEMLYLLKKLDMLYE